MLFIDMSYDISCILRVAASYFLNWECGGHAHLFSLDNDTNTYDINALCITSMLI